MLKRKHILFPALLLAAFLAASAHGMNRGDIREQIRNRIQDTTSTITTTDYSWSTDLLNKRINIVQTNIACDTLCEYARKVIFTTASVREYDKPDDCIIVDRVAYANVAGSTSSYNRLIGVDMYLLDRDRGAWDNETGSGQGRPINYYERGNKIGLYPLPSSTYAGTDTLKIDYFKRPADMTSDTDIPWDGEYSLYSFHDLIVDGVVLLCMQDLYFYSEAIALKKQEYKNEKIEMRRRIVERQGIQQSIGSPK